MKLCVRGHRLTDDNVYVRANGYVECRECRRIQRRQWDVVHPDRKQEQAARTYQKHLATRRARMRDYYSRNADTMLANMAQYRRDHPEEIRTARQLYKQLFPERVKEQQQATRAKNPEAYRRGYAIQRHKRRGAPGHCSSEQLQARIDFFGGLCWMCGAEWEHIDHVKPLSKGGSNWPANLRPACGPCNLRKSNQWPYDPCETASISA
jgi:5-methylcytosine-specific restriction endonuclease McrA